MRPEGESETPRLFEVAEVNALIPRLREAVEFMQERKRQLDEINSDIARTADTSQGNGHSGAARLNQVRRRGTALAAEIEAKVAELHALGAEVKGIEQGLVDFPSLRDGRVVYLCWQLGEDEIEWWHDLNTGFAGRRRI